MEFWCLLENQTIELIRTSIIFFYVFDSSHFFMDLIGLVLRCGFAVMPFWMSQKSILDFN